MGMVIRMADNSRNGFAVAVEFQESEQIHFDGNITVQDKKVFLCHERACRSNSPSSTQGLIFFKKCQLQPKLLGFGEHLFFQHLRQVTGNYSDVAHAISGQEAQLAKDNRLGSNRDKRFRY